MMSFSHHSYAQINRTLETKIADILAQLPTEDLEHSNKIIEEIIGLDKEGILQICDLLVPAGSGDDTQARFALHSLAVYTGKNLSSAENSLVEESFLGSLKKNNHNEIKTFLIRRLQFCGTNASVIALSAYLEDKNLYQPAIASLTSIKSPEATKAIFKATKKADKSMQPEFIAALGNLKYAEAESLIENLAKTDSKIIQQKSYQALAEIASPNSFKTLSDASKKANYNQEETDALNAFILYGNNLSKNGNSNLSTKAAQEILKNCTTENQLHFRSAAIQILSKNEGTSFTKTLVKESKNSNNAYSASVIQAASKNLNSSEISTWVKAYKSASPESKIQIIKLLQERKESEVLEKCVLPAINDKNESLRIAGIKALDFQEKSKSLPILFEQLKQSKSAGELLAIKATLLRICSKEDVENLALNINELNNSGKIVLIQVLAERNASSQFNTITNQLDNKNKELTAAVYDALKSIWSPEQIASLFTLLEETEDVKNIENAQKAIVGVLQNSDLDPSKIVFDAYNSSKQKEKIVPVLPYLNNENTIKLVQDQLNSGNEKQQLIALEALGNWQNNDAIPILFETASSSKNSDLHKKAFDLYIKQVSSSSYPEDQKLLLLQKIMPFSKSNQEKIRVIYACGNIKTFLSLVFVSEYLDDKDLLAAASNTAIKIALPTPGENNGLSGDVVKEILAKSVNNLTGEDSIYAKIDVKEYVNSLTSETGFISIFNGKNLTGWKGLVENPIARSKMSSKQLDAKEKKANEEMNKDWKVKDGILTFVGEGFKNICTEKHYGDFEMLLNWKIGKGGDSGVYLRGTPQVQIWDTALTDVGAQVGSGGLYNNQINESKPLKVADNPVNEWNTFHIKMIGERVTVYLNGELVVDNVIMENYWDKNQSIFPKEAIELQAHGEDVQFKNIYVREISSGDVFLSEEEKKEGFKSLFNGKDLEQWIGNKTDYLVINNEIAVRPKQGGHGNLYSVEEYADFIFRFEFKLSPGANNGLGIHAPLEGDIAYVGKELQILDDTAAIYATLEDYQYHGSVYGIIAAKKGFLNPVGEWNYEEVIVKGDDIKITLNGTVIVDGNFKEATKNGTIDGQEHPGLKRNKGHIAFLGHGSELEFRNIRIKDLNK